MGRHQCLYIYIDASLLLLFNIVLVFSLASIGWYKDCLFTEKIKILMKKFLLYFILSIVWCIALQAGEIQNNDDARQYSAEARPWVWWFWLGNAVTEDLIDKHMDAYAKAGYGGVVIIATYGVEGYEDKQLTYRSDEWYNMVNHTLKNAKRLNMKVDLALSSAWPFGGKQVVKQDGAKFLKRSLSFESNGIIDKFLIDDKDNEYIIAVSAFSDDGEYRDLTSHVSASGKLKISLPKGKWRIETVMGGYTNQHVKRSSPGGEGLVLDNFDRDALRNYLKDFEKDLIRMKGIRAVFNDSYEVYGADYTTTFISEFEKRRGYSPKPYLSLLFDKQQGDLHERFLCDYRATMADLILDNFTKEWTHWSNENLLLTMEQAHGSPSNVLDMYAAADIPQCESFGPSCFNIDKVRVDEDTRRVPYKRPDVLHMKFASSGANLMGNRLVSSETATWLTNHFRTALSQVKPEVDKLFVAGINHIHLISSTNTPLDSEYPGWVFYPAPDFGPRSSLMDYMPDFSLYVSRVQNVLQQSENDNDILLYYPVSDYFSETKEDLGVLTMMDHLTTKWGFDWPFAVTGRNLKDAGYQFDYVSDKLLQGMTVDNGMIKSQGGHLYKAVVIPACKRIPIETMTKLLQLAKSGVSVIFDSSMPLDVPGLHKVSERLLILNNLRETMRSVPQVFITEDVDSILQKLEIPKVGFTTVGLDFIRKSYKGGKIYFVANQDSRFNYGNIMLDAKYKNLTAYNPLTGDFYKLSATEREGRNCEIRIQLLPGESIIIFADNRIQKAEAYNEYIGKKYQLKGEWTISFGEEKNSPATLTTTKLRSWTELGDSTHCYYNGVGCYKLAFDLPKGLENSTKLRLKFSDVRDMAEVFINGKSIGRTWCVPYLLDFDAKLLKRKNNKIEIKVKNIATNKIIGMDRHHIKWKECYISDPKRGDYNTTDWQLEESGLVGDIYLIGND